MGIRKQTFYDSGARRRRLIYVLCGLVTAGSAVAILLLAGRSPPPSPRTGAEGTAERPPPRTGPRTPAVSPPPPAESRHPAPPPDPGAEELRAAEALFDRAMTLVRAAGPGSSGDAAARRRALDALLAARAAYEAYLEKHPAEEDRLEGRMTDLQRQIFWTRKAMSADEAPASVSEPRPSPPPPRRPPRRPPPARERPFRPAEALARLRGIAARALREGRPERIVEAGGPLLTDPRMRDHLEEVTRYVETARRMTAFLEAARRTLAARVGEVVRLRLRKGEIEGRLEAAEHDLAVREGGELRRIPLPDLAAVELAALADAGGALGDPRARRAAGAYLLLRGDGEEGARLLLLARAGGADVSAYEEPLRRATARSPELKALAAWLALAPALAGGGPELLERIERFKTEFRTTVCFADRREELFHAYAEAAEALRIRPEDHFRGRVKLAGRRGIDLLYPFEDPAELSDFDIRGKLEVAGGRLQGARCSLRLERFVPENVELRFVLLAGTRVTAGIWSREPRRGVNLRIERDPDSELQLTLLDGDRPFATKTLRDPGFPQEYVLARRGTKFLVRLNRRAVLKGSDSIRRNLEGLRSVGISCRRGEISLEELEVRTELDLEWIRAGGRRFPAFIRDWYAAGPWPWPGRDPRAALLAKFPPEEGKVRLGAGPDGEGPFHYIRADRGYLDLNRALRPPDRAAAYAAVRVWSPDRRSAVLEIACDALARAWLEGKPVLKEAAAGDPSRAAVKLSPGDNLLLVKVVRNGGRFWLAARFLTRTGEAMRDLQYW